MHWSIKSIKRAHCTWWTTHTHTHIYRHTLALCGHVVCVCVCAGFGRKNSLHQWLQLRNIVNLCKFSRRRRRCCPLCATPMRQAQQRERARHSSRHSRGRNANNINAVAVAVTVAPHRHDLHNFWTVCEVTVRGESPFA